MKCEVVDCHYPAKYSHKTTTMGYLRVEVQLCEMHYLSCFDHRTEQQAKEILDNAVLSPSVLE